MSSSVSGIQGFYLFYHEYMLLEKSASGLKWVLMMFQDDNEIIAFI